MNPIPLSAPDGRIYAYACGRCHHVGGGSSLIGTHDADGPHKRLTASSLRDAEGCCLCDCGAMIESGRWGGQCVRCDWIRRFAYTWVDIGSAATLGLPTLEAYDEHVSRLRDCEEDDDYYDGSP